MRGVSNIGRERSRAAVRRRSSCGSHFRGHDWHRLCRTCWYWSKAALAIFAARESLRLAASPPPSAWAAAGARAQRPVSQTAPGTQTNTTTLADMKTEGNA